MVRKARQRRSTTSVVPKTLQYQLGL
jgi:hypothetical protein